MTARHRRSRHDWARSGEFAGLHILTLHEGKRARSDQVNKSGMHRHRLSIRFGKAVAALSSGSRSMSFEPVASVYADRMSH
jgi:hypothetical protein